MEKNQESSLTGYFQIRKNKFCLNENIWLDFNIENKSEKTIYVFFHKEELEKIEIKIKEPSGYNKVHKEYELGVSFLPELELNPTENRAYMCLLDDWIKFIKPGNYTITISLKVEYNPVSIKADKPKKVNKEKISYERIEEIAIPHSAFT